MFARSLPAGFGTAASAYIVVRALGADAIVMRPTPSVSVTPVAFVHVAPLSVERQIWPSVVPVVAAWFASSDSVKFVPPPHAIDHSHGSTAWPVAIVTFVKLVPAFVERYRPLSVAAITIVELPGATWMSWIFVESPSSTGFDQLFAPSVDFAMPTPVPSNASPRPRYSVLDEFGSISSEPTARLPSVSVFADHVAPLSVDFHTPPPE